MISAEQLVENLLDANADSVDPKEMAMDIKSEQDAETARLKSEGTVNANTVTQYATIWHRKEKNTDGTAARAKVTSIKTWVTRPGDFQIGWKHGMRTYGTITPSNAADWTTVEPPPIPRAKRRR